MWCQWERAAFDDVEFENDPVCGWVHNPKALAVPRHTVDGDLCEAGTTPGPDVTRTTQAGADVLDPARDIPQLLKPDKREPE